MNRYETQRARRLKQVARFKKAYDMRQSGCIYRVIGEEVGVSGSYARTMAECYERHLNTTGYLMGIKL
jgi:hypothetical protein